MSKAVKCEIKEDIAILTLNDPNKLNALSKKMISELQQYFMASES